MKAITVCNPYPELILRLEKPIENRDRYWAYRGPLLLHAGKSHSWMGDGDYRRYPNLSWGAIVGSMNVVACLPIDDQEPWRRAGFEHLYDHEHANGPHCLIVQNVKRFAKPVPCRGALGIWVVPDDVQPLVMEQLKAVAA